MEYDEDYLVALVILHGGTFWIPEWSQNKECWIFIPGWDENTRLNGRTVDNVSVRATNRYDAALLYCKRHSLLPIEVSS